MELFKMFGSIFLQGGDETEKQIDNIDAKAGGVSSKLGGMIGTAAKWGKGIATATTAAGIALFGVANKAAGATDRIDKMSQKLGMTREGFQAWDYVLSQNGVSIDSLGAGMKTLTNQVDELAKGGKVATDAFGELGLSYEDMAGLTREEIFEKTIFALQGVDDEARRAAIANDLLGRSGQELAPLLNAGAGSAEELKQKAHELGLVLGDEAIDAGVLFTDTMDSLKRSLGAVFTTVGTMVMPMFQNAADWVQEHMPQIQAVFSTVFSTIGFLVNGFIEGIRWIIDWVQQWRENNTEQIEYIKNLFMGLFNAVQGFITSFVEAAIKFWQKYGDNIMGITSAAFDFIKSTIGTVLKVVTEIFNAFAAVFRGDWEALGDSIKKIWDALWGWIGSLGKNIYNIGKNIVQALWDGIKDMWSKMTSWVSDKVKSLLKSLNPFKGSSVTVSGPSIPAMATGGTVLRPGMALVGEAGPEILDLPRGATVTPLAAAGGGASVEGLQMGLKTLSRAADEAAQGVTTYSDIFDRLNVSVKDGNGNLKDQETLFNDTILALSKMENETERTALASQLLGRSAQELAPMLNSGAASVEELRAKAHELGLVLSDEAIDAGVLLTDTMDQLKRSFGAAFTTIGTMVMPMIQRFSEWIIENMPMIQEIFSTVFNVISTAVGYVVDTVMPSLISIFQTAYEVITAIWNKWGGEVGGTTTGLFDLIKNTVQNALAIVEGLIKVFGGILTGDFEMIKEGVMKIWSALWDWIKNLAGSAFEIGKNIVQGLWDGIKNMWGKLTSWVGDKVSGLLKKINPFSGGGSVNIPGMATGGTVLSPGRALIGEAGPEILDLPRGATVTPLAAAGGLVININEPHLFNNRDADKLGDLIANRIRQKTGLRI